jgi:hypothetical protein
MSFNKFALFAASVAAVLASATAPAFAQQYRAKVTLPFETRWGGAVLPAGDYVISTEAAVPVPSIHVRGEGVNVTVLSGSVGYIETGEEGGRLEIADVNGAHVVTKLHSGLAGKEFTFMIPKELKTQGYGVAALQKASLPVTSGR